MSHILPSQAVALIDRIGPVDSNKGRFSGMLWSESSDLVSVIVETVEHIPSYLIALEGEDYAAFAASLAVLKNALRMWPSQGKSFHSQPRTPGFPDKQIIPLLREMLAKCPDE